MTFRVEYTHKVSGSGFETDPGAEDLLSFIIEAFLLGPVCIFGIITNSITLMVLSRKEMQSTVNCLLFGLAICDMFFLTSQGIVFAWYNFCKFFGLFAKYRYHYDPLLTPALNWATVSGQTGSIYFTLAITIERFIVVQYPLHAKHISTMKRARGVSITIILIAILFGLPHFFGIGVTPKSGMVNSTTIDYIHYDYSYTEFGKQAFYTQYVGWGQTVFQFILPFIGLIVLNSFIAVKLQRAQDARSTFNASQRAEASVSKMLLCVVAVFGICHSLLLVDSVLSLVIAWKNISPTDSKYLFLVRSKMWCTLELLCGVNSASNFIIYCVMGNRFRASLVQMFVEFWDWVHCSTNSSRNSYTWKSQPSSTPSIRNKEIVINRTTTSKV